MDRRPRALLTGLSSSLVSKCALALIDKGFEVVCTSRRSQTTKGIAPLRLNFEDESTWAHQELEKPFDFVLHGASCGPGVKGADHFQANTKGPLAFFSKVQYTPESVFFFTSSSSIYGSHRSGTVTEESSPQPDSTYAFSKLSFEKKVKNIIPFHSMNMKLVILRIPTLLGSKVSQNLISTWFGVARRGESIQVFNPHEPFNALISEEKVIEKIFFEYSIRSRSKTMTLNCHSNGDLTYFQLAQKISKTFNARTPIEVKAVHKPLSLSNRKDSWFSSISTKQIFEEYLYQEENQNNFRFKE